MLGLSHQYGKSFNRRSTPSVVSWAVGFEKVLQDSMGLKTFTEFLKREFSAENIKFWMICEEYRKQTDKHQRRKMAKDIVENHLCSSASEPVNIDSQSRQKAIDGMESAQQDLFLPAQKQIFTLMKFDCYQRFLKSDLFAESLTAEKLGKPLPYQNNLTWRSPKKSRSRSKSRDRNHLLYVNKLNVAADDSSTNNKNCASSPDEPDSKEELDEKKRKSLLPWQKSRGKSADPERSNSRSPVLHERNAYCRKSKRKTTEKTKTVTEAERTASKMNSLQVPSNEPIRLPVHEKIEGHPEMCRVILPDSSAAVVATSSNEAIGDAIQKLMVKHGLPVTAVDTFSKKTLKIVDLSAPLTNFVGQELLVELRTLIRLELPSKKVVVIKSRPERTCLETLEPVLKKYGLDIWKVTLQLASTQTSMNLNGPISAANRCQINVLIKDSITESQKSDDTSLFYEKVKRNDVRREKEREKKVNSILFEEILRGNARFVYDELGILDFENFKINSGDQMGATDQICNNEDGVRRNSFTVAKEKCKPRSLYPNRVSIHEGMGIKIPLNENMAPPLVSTSTVSRKSITKNVHYRDSCDLSAVWSRVQKRLDDQRGTEINCELPDFLKPKGESQSPTVSESDL